MRQVRVVVPVLSTPSYCPLPISLYRLTSNISSKYSTDKSVTDGQDGGYMLPRSA